MSLIEQLNWRYATKKFDTNKELTPEQLDTLLTAIQLSPSSYGLQHYKVIVVKDPAVRQKLREAGYNQPQITDASHLLVFAAEANINEDYVKNFIDLVAEKRGVPRESLAGFENVLLGSIASRNAEQRLIWAQKQAYIALGLLVTAAALHHIDAGPMEGFDAAKFDEILGLPEKGLTATVIAAVGFRADDDAYVKLEKVRKPKEDLFIHI